MRGDRALRCLAAQSTLARDDKKKPHRRLAPGAANCTARAAVTSAALDSEAKTSAEYGVRGKIPAEDFHTTKKFVLVCRSGSAFENFLYSVEQRHEARTGAFRKKLTTATSEQHFL
jgi:hypothetical protein